MKTIGVLGGMSWESSVEYERIIHEEVRRRLGGTHSARTIVWTPDFADIEDLQEAGEWDAAAALLGEAGARLAAAGADLLVLATNTMHTVADDVAESAGIPLLHIGDVIAAAVTRAGIETVGLLGTRYTMERPFLRDRLAGRGLEVLVPGDNDRATVHRVIFDELVQGIVSDRSRAEYVGVIDRLVADGAEGVILGCTEIELLVGPGDVDVPVFPTTRLHAVAAVEAALA